MWFDVTAALAEIESGAEPAPKARPLATSATPATQTPKPRPLSRLSQVSQSPEVENAGHGASVATPSAQADTSLAWEPKATTHPAPPSRQQLATPSASDGDDMGRQRKSGTGARLTWTGRLASPEDWGRLTQWEKHGPFGQFWCGCCTAWVASETALAHADARRAEWIATKGG